MAIDETGVLTEKSLQKSTSSSRCRNIAITNMYGGLGGGEIAILSHIEYLRSRGKNIFLYLLEDGPFRKAAEDAGASVVIRPLSWQGGRARFIFHLSRTIADFSRFLRREEIQLTISYTFNDLVIAGIASRIHRKPIVYRSQGDVFKSSSELPKTWMGPFVIPAVKLIRPYIITTTKREMEILGQLGFRSNRLAHVYLGTRRDQSISDTSSLREKYGWDDRVPIAGIFGRLIRWKGHETVLRAIGRLKHENLQIGLWIIGSSDFGDGDRYVRFLKRVAEEEGIADMVRFLGFREDSRSFMEACDMVCHASEFEPFGMVIIEAMMASRPVIASDVSGPRESIEDGVTGILVTPGDVNAYANALRHLVQSPESRSAMGKKARERACRLFDQEKNLDRLHEICESQVYGRL